MKIQNVSGDVIPIYVNKGTSLKNKLQPGDCIEVSEEDARWNTLKYYGQLKVIGKKAKEKADKDKNKGSEAPVEEPVDTTPTLPPTDASSSEAAQGPAPTVSGAVAGEEVKGKKKGFLGKKKK